MKYLSSVNLLIMVPRFPGLKHETIPSFYAQTEFVCVFSNANLLKEVCIISFVVMLHLTRKLSFFLVKPYRQICGKFFSQNSFRPNGVRDYRNNPQFWLNLNFGKVLLGMFACDLNLGQGTVTTTTTNSIKNWKITNYVTFPPANSL